MSRLTEIWSDETGWLSSARILLWLDLVFTLGVVFLDAHLAGKFDVPSHAYSLLGGIFSGLIIWAAGPRVGTYLADALKGLPSAIASAKDRQPDRMKDDES